MTTTEEQDTETVLRFIVEAGFERMNEHMREMGKRLYFGVAKDVDKMFGLEGVSLESDKAVTDD